MLQLTLDQLIQKKKNLEYISPETFSLINLRIQGLKATIREKNQISCEPEKKLLEKKLIEKKLLEKLEALMPTNILELLDITAEQLTTDLINHNSYKNPDQKKISDFTVEYIKNRLETYYKEEMKSSVVLAKLITYTMLEANAMMSSSGSVFSDTFDTLHRKRKQHISPKELEKIGLRNTTITSSEGKIPEIPEITMNVYHNTPTYDHILEFLENVENSESPKKTKVFIKNQQKTIAGKKKIVEYFITVLNQDRILLGKEELPKLLTALNKAYGGFENNKKITSFILSQIKKQSENNPKDLTEMLEKLGKLKTEDPINPENKTQLLNKEIINFMKAVKKTNVSFMEITEKSNDDVIDIFKKQKTKEQKTLCLKVLKHRRDLTEQQLKTLLGSPGIWNNSKATAKFLLHRAKLVSKQKNIAEPKRQKQVFALNELIGNALRSHKSKILLEADFTLKKTSEILSEIKSLNNDKMKFKAAMRVLSGRKLSLKQTKYVLNNMKTNAGRIGLTGVTFLEIQLNNFEQRIKAVNRIKSKNDREKQLKVLMEEFSENQLEKYISQKKSALKKFPPKNVKDKDKQKKLLEKIKSLQDIFTTAKKMGYFKETFKNTLKKPLALGRTTVPLPIIPEISNNVTPKEPEKQQEPPQKTFPQVSTFNSDSLVAGSQLTLSPDTVIKINKHIEQEQIKANKANETQWGELKIDEKNIPRFVGANPIKALEHCGNKDLKRLTYVLEIPLHYALGKLPADTHKKAVAEAEKLLANCTDDIRNKIKGVKIGGELLSVAEFEALLVRTKTSTPLIPFPHP